MDDAENPSDELRALARFTRTGDLVLTRELGREVAGALRRWSSDEEALSKREHCYSAQLLRQAWDYLVRRAPS